VFCLVGGLVCRPVSWSIYKRESLPSRLTHTKYERTARQQDGSRLNSQKYAGIGSGPHRGARDGLHKAGTPPVRESPVGRQAASRRSDSASTAGKCACLSRPDPAIAGLTLPTDAAVEKNNAVTPISHVQRGQIRHAAAAKPRTGIGEIITLSPL